MHCTDEEHAIDDAIFCDHRSSCSKTVRFIRVADCTSCKMTSYSIITTYLYEHAKPQTKNSTLTSALSEYFNCAQKSWKCR